MKKILLALILAACGDNITRPDAPEKPTFTPPTVEPEPTDVQTDDAAPLDAGVMPDACVDSHIDLNGQMHKCQHDQDLPSTP